jgi:diaminopropionate ammonia-lyase
MATEILRNPGRGALPLARAAGSPRAFHRRLPGYAATPLHSTPALAADLGLQALLVKDESSRLGLPSFKVLGASWATYRLICSLLGREPVWSTLEDLAAAVAPLGIERLVAATDGNHGRAVARWLGVGAHILVPAGTADARMAGIASEGASVEVVHGTYDEAVAASAALASDRALVVSDTSWEGYTEVPAWVADGYATILDEVDDQLLGGSPDVVVVQMGVGALAAAVARRWAGRALVVVVEPDTAACGLRSAAAGTPVEVPGPHGSIMAGLNCGNVSPIAWPTVSAGADVFVAIQDAAAESAMRALAGVGVIAGETGASGLAGLTALCADGGLHGRTALVISTEGATDPVAYERIVGRSPSH